MAMYLKLLEKTKKTMKTASSDVNSAKGVLKKSRFGPIQSQIFTYLLRTFKIFIKCIRTANFKII